MQHHDKPVYATDVQPY